MTRSPLESSVPDRRFGTLPGGSAGRRAAAGGAAAPAAKRALLGMIPLLALAVATLSFSDAQAVCTPASPVDNDLVTCDGTDSDGFDGSGATGLTITTDGAAELDDSSALLDSAIRVSSDNTVTIGADATITVVDPDGAGIRGDDRNVVTNDGTITVDGARGIGIAVGDGADVAPPGTPPTIRNNGTITLVADDAIGIRTNDNNDVTIGSGGVVQITGDRGIGVRTGDDNIVVSGGAFTIDGDDGVAIQIGSNTGLPIPNGAASLGSITINGTGGTGIVSGDNSGISFEGTVDLLGAMGRGLFAGNKTDQDAQANITNQATITVQGDGSIGLSVGDGWIDGGAIRGANATVNAGDIIVSGANTIGIFAGNDASNTNGDHNSFVTNISPINVTGTDAIGVSLGGNNVLDPGDAAFANRYSFENSGRIEGDDDAGPLVVFRNSFGSVFENRLVNRPGGAIVADRSSPPGTPNRGVAIQGTSGIERVENFGSIEGEVRLGAGADIYRHGSTATLAGIVRGGAGTDTAILGPGGGAPRSFDLSVLEGFESLEIEGFGPSDGGWELTNASGFGQTVRVRDNGVLRATSPVTLGGDLRIDPNGNVRVDFNPSQPQITVQGDATFDGNIEIDLDAARPLGGTFRIIQVDGDRGASVFATESIPTSGGIFVYSTEYDADGFSLVIVESSAVAIAQGANRSAVAAHLDSINQDVSSPADLRGQIDDFFFGTGDLNDLYDALSPEPYDAQTTLVAEGSLQVASLLLNRPRECRPGQLDPWQASTRTLPCHARSWSPWVSAIGSIRERDAFAGHPKYDSQMGGLVFGIDTRPLRDLELTFAVSSQRGQVDVRRYGESDLVLADISGHAAWNLGPVRLQSVVSWGYGSHNSRRLVQYAGGNSALNVNAKDDFDSQHVGVSGQAGWLIETGSIDIEPLVGFDYTWVSQDEVREKDAGLFGLVIDDRDDDIFSAVAGLRLSTVYHHTRYLHTSLLWMDGVWRPSVDLRWRQTFSGYDRDVTARIASAPDTVSSFTIEGKEDKGGFEVSAGLAFEPEAANRLQFELRYDAYRSAHTVQHDLVAKVRLGF